MFGSGGQTRDYVYIDDVVDAWLRAAASDVTGALNVGTGVRSSVLDLVAALGLEHVRAPARAGEVEHSCLAPGRAADALGWRAALGLADGLARTRAAAG